MRYTIFVPKRGKKEETIFSFESFERDALKQRRAHSLLPFVPKIPLYFHYILVDPNYFDSHLRVPYKRKPNLWLGDKQYTGFRQLEAQREKEKLKHSSERYDTEGIRHRDNHPFYAGLRAINYRSHLCFLSPLSFEPHVETPSHYFSSFKRDFILSPSTNFNSITL